MSAAVKKIFKGNGRLSVVPTLKVLPEKKQAQEVPVLSSLEGVKLLGTSFDYRHRRKWVSLDQSTYSSVSGSSKLLKDVIHESLKKVFQDLRQVGRISIVSFGVDTPFVLENPDRFVVLSSSERDTTSLARVSFDSRSYPEMLEAYRLRHSVIVPDVRLAPSMHSFLSQIEKTGARSVAAIPLLTGSKTFGVIKARMSEVDSEASQELLTDLSSYSLELARFVSQYDFFARIYRGIKR